MKLLFDAHAFLWWDGAPSKLSAHVLAMCQDPAAAIISSDPTVRMYPVTAVW